MKKIILGIIVMSNFSFLSAEKVFQHEEFSSENVKNITIEATSGEVKFSSDSGSGIIVETYSNKRKVAEAKINLSGDTLSVDTTGMSFNLKQPNVRILFPSGFSFGNLTLKISSGDIDIDGVNCDEMNIILTSGDLGIHKSKATGDIKIKSTSGNISIDAVCANFKAELTSGNIYSDLTCDIFDAKSTSGRIGCYGSIYKKVIAEAHSGKIDVYLPKMPSEKSSLKTNSGTIVLTFPKDNDGYTAIANTYSGVFKDYFTGMKATNCKNTTSVYKNGGAEFELSVKSGTIKIEEFYTK